MKGILRNPIFNAVCLSAFTAFYSLIFIFTSNSGEFVNSLYYREGSAVHPFWTGWSEFLAAGHQVFIAYVLIAVTSVVVVMLVLRRRQYDEYHIAKLFSCLAVATMLLVIAIALFYFLLLHGANGIIEKFTLFIVIHWSTVVLSDLVYVLVCRWR